MRAFANRDDEPSGLNSQFNWLPCDCNERIRRSARLGLRAPSVDEQQTIRSLNGSSMQIVAIIHTAHNSNPPDAAHWLACSPRPPARSHTNAASSRLVSRRWSIPMQMSNRDASAAEMAALFLAIHSRAHKLAANSHSRTLASSSETLPTRRRRAARQRACDARPGSERVAFQRPFSHWLCARSTHKMAPALESRPESGPFRCSQMHGGTNCD